ncbi:RNA-directed DNA polymerase, eukaryota, reverse transcriptase zinc-binding domain protein [Tanacetum coccineum]|uniref:RNA-directed DNA polymerase, eukaryota, reverse transcriptase zinc-binding domain protein n=1 Tax=Tanacetum coccineum TaxID=301880 RepID=A0ABQ4ZEX0_9ASTR
MPQNKKPNVPVNLSTRTKPATESRKPMPKCHTRNHRILPNESVNARRAADHNRKLNVVDHNQFVIRSLKFPDYNLVIERPGCPGDTVISDCNPVLTPDINVGWFETNKLVYVPIVFTKVGNEVVVFYEDLIEISSKKWELTLCGHLVGHYMGLPPLKYHLRRMWSRTGFKEIMDNGNGRWLFKFNNEQGMNSVVEQSPWMVNSKPLMVYKWDPSLGMNKVELTKIHVWVKLLEVPMEAWSTEEISAISSSVRRPSVMDNMAAYVCKNGTGRTEFARVLVEMEASKGFKEEVVLQYRDKNQNVKGTKVVKIAYDWKPPLCSHCGVFGHDFKNCKKRTRTEEEIAKEREENDLLNSMEGIVEDVLDDESMAGSEMVADELNGASSSLLN